MSFENPKILHVKGGRVNKLSTEDLIAADVVIDSEGRVVKDRHGLAGGRPATIAEIARAEVIHVG